MNPEERCNMQRFPRVYYMLQMQWYSYFIIHRRLSSVQSD